MKKRNISKKNVLLALLLTIVIFSSGVILGNNLVERKHGHLQNIQQETRIQTQSLTLHYDIIAENPCFGVNTSYLVSELSSMGERIDFLESIYGKSSKEILLLKQQYSDLQIRHWLIQKRAIEKCNLSTDLILFFYSNENCPQCERQGEILSAFKNRHKENVLIYSHEIALNDPASITLREIHNIKQVPSIVYNSDVFHEFVSLNQLERIRSKE